MLLLPSSPLQAQDIAAKCANWWLEAINACPRTWLALYCTLQSSTLQRHRRWGDSEHCCCGCCCCCCPPPICQTVKVKRIRLRLRPFFFPTAHLILTLQYWLVSTFYFIILSHYYVHLLSAESCHLLETLNPPRSLAHYRRTSTLLLLLCGTVKWKLMKNTGKCAA